MFLFFYYVFFSLNHVILLKYKILNAFWHSVLQSMGLQKVRYNLVTEQQQYCKGTLWKVALDICQGQMELGSYTDFISWLYHFIK